MADIDVLAARDEHKHALRVTLYDVVWPRPYGCLDVEQMHLAKNPIGYWLMEFDGSDAINYGLLDSVNDGALLGAVSQTDSILGLPKQTAVFTGTQTMQAGVIDIADTTHYRCTISCFIQPTGATRAAVQVLWAKCAADVECELALVMTTTNGLKVYANDVEVLDYPTAIPSTEATHVAVTYADGDYNLLVNGSVVATATAADLTEVPEARFSVGGTVNAAGTYLAFTTWTRYAGKIEAVAVYNYLVPTPAIRKWYVLGRTKTYYDPRTDWDTAAVESFNDSCA